MRTTELALASAVILGCIFKIAHWPGAGMFIFSGGCGLALFYFPFGFRTLPAPKRTDQILWMTLLVGVALSAALAGVVAFLLRWPNSARILLSGAIGCAISAMAGLVLRIKHPRLDIYVDGLLIRCLVLGALAITLWTLFAGKPH
jgi:hypothetical protein